MRSPECNALGDWRIDSMPFLYSRTLTARGSLACLERGSGQRYDASLPAAPWCSGLTCHPVKVEIVGSNPIGVASHFVPMPACVRASLFPDGETSSRPAKPMIRFQHHCRLSCTAASIPRLYYPSGNGRGRAMRLYRYRSYPARHLAGRLSADRRFETVSRRPDVRPRPGSRP